MAQRAQAALPPQPPALLPPPADAPPLLRACLAGDSACALELLQNGASATDTLPGGVTALHTAALGGAAGAVPALVAAGLSVDAGLEGPVQLFEVQFDRTAEAPAGTTPLALAAALGHASAVEALLAAGATHELPSLIDQHWYGSGLFENGATSPWHWVAEHIRGRDAERAAGAAAVRAQLLAHVLQRCAASAPAPQPDQLLALCVAAVLPPACTDKLAALAALPGAADLLGEVRLRRLAQSAVERGDAVVVEALQASPLRLQPLDPQGSLLEGIARKRGEDALPMARALLQHGTRITLTAINQVVTERLNAALLELLLGSGLPLPAVPTGRPGRPVSMFDGEYGSPDEFHDVCCPFYSLLRRDCHYLMQTPQELRVRMCQALLRAGFRPTVYKSIELQVLDKEATGYDAKALPDFHILRDWGRLGLAAGGCERICCFPGANPQQDRLLAGDNRLLWMLIEGKPWSPADHRYWPPAFKAAARTLLLAHRRGAPTAAARPTRASSRRASVELQATPLSPLPKEFVLGVIAAAAFPLDAWFDAASREAWLATEFWRELKFFGF